MQINLSGLFCKNYEVNSALENKIQDVKRNVLKR